MRAIARSGEDSQEQKGSGDEENRKISKWGEKFEKSLTKRLTNCYLGGGRLVDDINFGGEEYDEKSIHRSTRSAYAVCIHSM